MVADSVPAIMNMLSLHTGTELVIRPRDGTPPVDYSNEFGPSGDVGSTKADASTDTQVDNRE